MTETAGEPPRDDRLLVERVRSTLHDRLRDVLQGATRVALLDFPYHRNAGDAAIWAGERAALRDLGVEVAYVADAGRFDAGRLREALPEGPVLLSGGGNVGDLWLWSQTLRERVLRDLPDRRVVQLSQSVHFDHPAAARSFRDVVRSHGGYVFLARDRDSAARAGELDPAEVVLAPDMAFGLGPLTRRALPSRSVLALARDDREAISGLRDGARGAVDVEDWSLGTWGDLRWQATRTVPRLARYAVANHLAWRAVASTQEAAMESMCRQVLDRGVDLLSSARVVVTDRLHAHLLCVLLGVPHVVLDNSYGKIRALHDVWTAESRTTVWADDVPTALTRARELAERG